MRGEKRCLNRDVIKYIAVFTMVLNHVANAHLVTDPILADIFINIGYFTAITMCRFLVEGFHYTRSIRKYLLRLFVFGLLSQAPYMYLFDTSQLNMLFSLCICLLALVSFTRIPEGPARTLVLLLLVLCSVWTDWGVLAPLFTLFFERAGEDRRAQIRAYLISALLVVLMSLLSLGETPAPREVCSALLSGIAPLLSGVVILNFYNGKRFERGRTFHKWFFYIFYPAHLVVLCVIREAVGG